MILNIIFLLIGLFLGWFFIPQPAWSRTALNWLLSKIPFLKGFVTTTTPPAA